MPVHDKAQACQSYRVTAISPPQDVQYSVRSMIMNRGIADGGEWNEGARLGLLDRRSFLLGSAASLSALGLAGCVSIRRRAPRRGGEALRPVPTEKFPSRRPISARSIRNIFVRRCATPPMKRPVRSSSIPAITMFTASKGDGNATRYGANVGRSGFLWSGEA